MTVYRSRFDAGIADWAAVGQLLAGVYFTDIVGLAGVLGMLVVYVVLRCIVGAIIA